MFKEASFSVARRPSAAITQITTTNMIIPDKIKNHVRRHGGLDDGAQRRLKTHLDKQQKKIKLNTPQQYLDHLENISAGVRRLYLSSSLSDAPIGDSRANNGRRLFAIYLRIKVNFPFINLPKWEKLLCKSALQSMFNTECGFGRLLYALAPLIDFVLFDTPCDCTDV